MENKKQGIVRRHSNKFLQLCFALLLLSTFAFFPLCQSFDYSEALSKGLLYFESQRSGHLPHNQRVTWRHHSGLTDGLEQGVSPFFITPFLKITFIKHVSLYSSYSFQFPYPNCQTSPFFIPNSQNHTKCLYTSILSKPICQIYVKFCI